MSNVFSISVCSTIQMDACRLVKRACEYVCIIYNNYYITRRRSDSRTSFRRTLRSLLLAYAQHHLLN